MARRILSVATLGLVKPKKKAAPAPAQQAEQKGPIITQLGGAQSSMASVAAAAQRRRGIAAGVGNILSDKLGS